MVLVGSFEVSYRNGGSITAMSKSYRCGASLLICNAKLLSENFPMASSVVGPWIKVGSFARIRDSISEIRHKVTASQLMSANGQER